MATAGMQSDLWSGDYHPGRSWFHLGSAAAWCDASLAVFVRNFDCVAGGLSVAEAGPVRLTYTGTVTDISGPVSLGYSVGQTVTYFLTVAEGNPSVGSPGSWREEDSNDPSLWFNAGGTGLSGVYAKAPAIHPYERLYAFDVSGEARLEMFLNTDSPSPTANHGIVSEVDSGWFLKQLQAGDYFPALTIPDPIPATPVELFSGVFGTYSAKLTRAVTNKFEFRNSLAERVTVTFDPVSLSIGAEPSPIPEPSTCLLLGLGAVAVGCFARRKTA